MRTALWQAQSGAAGDSENISIVITLIAVSLIVFLLGGKKRK